MSLLVSRPVISQSIQTRGCLERDSGIATVCGLGRVERAVMVWGFRFGRLSTASGRVSGG